MSYSFFGRLMTIACLMVLSPLGLAVESDEKRYALLIGNADYQVQKLRNPTNDVDALAEVLKQVGFHITIIKNANHQEMDAAIYEFSEKIRKHDAQKAVALVYYSGHGMQVDGKNYLIPIDAIGRIKNKVQLKHNTIDLDYLLASLPEIQIKILLLDACRDNPLPSFTKSGTKGLARMDGGRNKIIGYAAEPGEVAEDGDDHLSPYAKHLYKNIPLINVPIGSMLINVTSGVRRDTNNKQSPDYVMSTDKDFYFNRISGQGPQPTGSMFCESIEETVQQQSDEWTEESDWSNAPIDGVSFCNKAKTKHQNLYSQRKVKLKGVDVNTRQIIRFYKETEYQVQCHFVDTWEETTRIKKTVPCPTN